MTESESAQAEKMSNEREWQELEFMLEQLRATRQPIREQHEPRTARAAAPGVYSAARDTHFHDRVALGEPPLSSTVQARRNAEFYNEVRRAVGRGVPTVLLGTSTRSLERSLAKLTAAADQHASSDLRERPSLRPLDEEQVPAQPDDADRTLDAATVQDALDSLSAAHRTVLMLLYDEGLTQTQIAERLGLPLGTVKTRAFHGLRALKSALAQLGYGG